jgi:endonuclease YncB( thermonuclease family)
MCGLCAEVWAEVEGTSDPAPGRFEGEARGARRGLWADPHPMPPWEYRQRRGVARAGS